MQQRTSNDGGDLLWRDIGDDWCRAVLPRPQAREGHHCICVSRMARSSQRLHGANGDWPVERWDSDGDRLWLPKGGASSTIWPGRYVGAVPRYVGCRSACNIMQILHYHELLLTCPKNIQLQTCSNLHCIHAHHYLSWCAMHFQYCNLI